MSLQHLFDAELRHRPGMEPILPAADGDGELIGSGDGTITGQQLSGTLRWTLFEHPGELLCSMNPVALIETEDGAEIRLQARGYARRRRPDERTWRVAATLHFESDDEHYRWLGQTLGVWEGEFEADAARASYRAYVQTDWKGESVRDKAAIVVLADTETHGELGRLVNALSTADEFKEHGEEVTIIFDGAGVRWAAELSKPEHRLHERLEGLRDKVAGACHYCAGAFEVRDELERIGFPLLRDHKGHPSLRSLVHDGYELITF